MENTLKGNPAVMDVTLLGAVPDDGADDTAAFAIASRSGAGVYVPEGEFIISDTISLFNNDLTGAGSGKTILTARIEDPAKPIIACGRSVSVSGLTVRYEQGLVTGSEISGQRVGISCGYNQHGLERGSSITDIRMENMGTGFFAKRSPGGDESTTCFSVLLSDLCVTDFSYRGLDMSCSRTGNIYRNITLSSDYENVNCMLFLGGEETECFLENILLENTSARTPLKLDGSHGFVFRDVTLRGVSAKDGGDDCLVYLRDSTGTIGTIDFDRCSLLEGQSLFSVGPCMYNAFDTIRLLKIGKLSLEDLKLPESGNAWFFERDEGKKGSFWIDVEEYAFTADGAADFYTVFPVTEATLGFLRKGAVPVSGTTEERPDRRLCAFASRYYDETLKKDLIWDGSEWQVAG